MIAESATEGLLKREPLVTLGGVGAITIAAWAWLVTLAADPISIDGSMSMTAELRPWTAAEAGSMFVMWAVMMVAMMTPSAAPVVLLYARIARRHHGRQAFAPAGVFYLGYLALWLAFSLLMTVLQWGLEQAALMSPLMAGTSSLLGGLILIAAGVYQWLPLKNACLNHCRSPVQFLSTHWRPGTQGAFRMGVEHGAYCLGCCWALMLLLFVGGVMNLLWVAAIAIFVLVEKAAPFGRAAGRVASILLIAGGVAMIGGA
jgi:predicted metal-binding membrane protein